MKKLWEDTVVTALRDAQWLHCKDGFPKRVAPSGFIKLDGNAESALGDLVYSANSRYYIIEVKSSSKDISSEWIGGSADNSGRKKVYSNLADRWHMLQESVDEGCKEDIYEHTTFVRNSVACHLLSYWEHWSIEGVGVGSVVVTPYLSGCMRHLDPEKFGGNLFIDRYFDSDFLLGKHAEKDEYIAEAAGVDFLFESGSRVFAVSDLDGGNVSWSVPMGLKLNDFQKYIDDLVGQAGDDTPEMHGIMISSCGRFFEVFASLSQLKLTMDFLRSANALKPDSLRLRPAPSGSAALIGLRTPKP